MLDFLVVIGALAGGFVLARDFVRTRLRFVDRARHPLAPLIAGVGAAIVALPLAILPVITAGTAGLFGLGAGLGTRSGQKLLGRGE